MKSRGLRSRWENQANDRSKALLTEDVVSRIVHHRGRQEDTEGPGLEFTSICKNSCCEAVILAYYPRKAATSYVVLEIGTDCDSSRGPVSLYNFIARG